MADTSLNENRIGLLIWQTSNLWQSKLRNKLSKCNISFNEYLIIETVYNLSNISNNISQIDIVYNSFIDKSVVSAKLSQLAKKKLIKKMTSNDNRSNRLILTKEGINIIESIIDEDIDIEDYYIDTINTIPAESPTLFLFGNTWKSVQINPFILDTSTVLQVFAKVDSVSEIQGIGFSNNTNEIKYSDQKITMRIFRFIFSLGQLCVTKI